jgi:phosphopantothenoylcysteine decarboxylase/phosphopantothenate--cysteine ligase
MSAPTIDRLRDGDNPGGGSIASILVTAGPTHEYLDDVRYFANGSSGRMGYALAEAALAGGHEVVLVSGPTGLPPPRGADLRAVTSALEMQAAVDTAVVGSDVVIAVAAVADYRPATRHAGKLGSGAEGFTVEMVRNPDILADLGRRRAAGEIDPVLVGFALQAGTPDEILALGRAKLQGKQLDLIVVNHVAAMGAAVSEATLVSADGRTEPLGRRDKTELAHHILAAVEGILVSRTGRPEPKTDTEGGSEE